MLHNPHTCNVNLNGGKWRGWTWKLRSSKKKNMQKANNICVNLIELCCRAWKKRVAEKWISLMRLRLDKEMIEQQTGKTASDSFMHHLTICDEHLTSSEPAFTLACKLTSRLDQNIVAGDGRNIIALNAATCGGLGKATADCRWGWKRSLFRDNFEGTNCCRTSEDACFGEIEFGNWCNRWLVVIASRWRFASVKGSPVVGFH